MFQSSKPLVTVSVPAYNGQRFVESCLMSIKSQTYENIEVIISDNCSTDETYSEILKNIALVSGARCIRTATNLGAISNINHLLENARGEFFIIWALDDNKPPDFIDECVKSFEKKPDAALCIPQIEMSLMSTGQLIARFETKTPVDVDDPCSRFKASLYKIPATAFYGLYSKRAMDRLGRIPRKLAGDLAYLQGLSLVGGFVYSPNATFEFKIRDKWNTSDEDLKFFFGSEVPQKSRLAFLSFYIETGKFVWSSDHSAKIRIRCTALLIMHLLTTKFQRIFLKFISIFLPKQLARKFGISFYFRYLHPEYINVCDLSVFESRIVLPILRYW